MILFLVFFFFPVGLPPDSPRSHMFDLGSPPLNPPPKRPQPPSLLLFPSPSPYLPGFVDRIEPTLWAQSGDWEFKNGTGGRSVYGLHFKDESHKLKHTGRGVVSMVVSRPNTSNSQFMIALDKTEWRTFRVGGTDRRRGGRGGWEGGDERDWGGNGVGAGNCRRTEGGSSQRVEGQGRGDGHGGATAGHACCHGWHGIQGGHQVGVGGGRRCGRGG